LQIRIAAPGLLFSKTGGGDVWISSNWLFSKNKESDYSLGLNDFGFKFENSVSLMEFV